MIRAPDDGPRPRECSIPANAWANQLRDGFCRARKPKKMMTDESSLYANSPSAGDFKQKLVVPFPKKGSKGMDSRDCHNQASMGLVGY